MKSPRFFCENCGAEVDRNTKNCPSCGRFFSSVRCPSCGFTGAEGLFSGGCPVCGYSAPLPGHSGGASRGKKFPGRNRPPLRAAGALPVWVYILTIFSLLCVFGIFFFTLR
ncbi:MAG: hypothetical protein LBL28_06375 [Treponema sp.]|nr:hypothetical protein [Treponema sp.]